MTQTFPMLIVLNREWEQLDLSTATTVAQWALREPALAGCRSLSCALEAGRNTPDAAFAALLRIGRTGDALAYRVILHSLLGLLVRLAHGRPGVFEEAVAEAWLLIAEYPLERRPRSIVANLAWALRRWSVTERPPLPAPGDLPAVARDEAEPDPSATLATARELGLIDQLTHQVLVSVYLVGKSSAEAGHDFGLSAQAVRWRCSNALRNLNRQAALLAG